MQTHSNTSKIHCESNYDNTKHQLTAVPEKKEGDKMFIALN